MRLGEFQKHLRKQGVFVVEFLEIQQRVEQRSPFPLGDSYGKKKHQLKIRCPCRHDAHSVRIRGNQSCRNARLEQIAVIAHSRPQDADRDRIQHPPVVFQIGKTVPCRARFQAPAGLIVQQQFFRRIGKIVDLAALAVIDLRGVPDQKEPGFPGGELPVQTGNGLPEIHGIANDFLRKRRPPVPCSAAG